jgi:Cof subfamily protein (haloacid dehalogenase superfamily)
VSNMARAPVELVALDLDGTLLGPDGTLSTRSVAALVAARDAGIVVTVATGRPPMILDAIWETSRRSISHVVGSNGSMIASFPGPDLIRLVGFAIDLAREAVVRLRSVDPRYGFALATDAGFVHEAGFAERMPAAVGGAPVPDVLTLGGTEAFKLLVFHPEVAVRDLVTRVPEALGHDLARHLAVSHMGADAAEIGPTGIDKATGLAWLCEHLAIDASAVVAVGDEWNDVTMLQWAGHGVAMAHADQRVLDAADEIAPSNRDDGAAVVLERLVASLDR